MVFSLAKGNFADLGSNLTNRQHTYMLKLFYTFFWKRHPGRFGKYDKQDIHTQLRCFTCFHTAGKGTFPGRFGCKSVKQTDIHTLEKVKMFYTVKMFSGWKRHFSRQIWVQICQTNIHTYMVKVFYNGKT